MRTDPVTAKLGKDVAHLVYYHVHKIELSIVHQEYFRKFVGTDERSVPIFYDGSRVAFGSRFYFNHRNPDNKVGIARWNKSVVYPLPKNY